MAEDNGFSRKKLKNISPKQLKLKIWSLHLNMRDICFITNVYLTSYVSQCDIRCGLRLLSHGQLCVVPQSRFCVATIGSFHTGHYLSCHCSVTSVKNKLHSSTTNATALPCMNRIQFENGQWWENRSCTLASSCYSLSLPIGDKPQHCYSSTAILWRISVWKHTFIAMLSNCGDTEARLWHDRKWLVWNRPKRQ
jgi:hypothetical protein